MSDDRPDNALDHEAQLIQRPSRGALDRRRDTGQDGALLILNTAADRPALTLCSRGSRKSHERPGGSQIMLQGQYCP